MPNGGDAGVALQLVGMLLCAGAIYGGIRAEQKAMLRDIVRQQKEIEKFGAQIEKIRMCRRFDDAQC